jgi:predicted amidohydrolase YtcJ
MFGLYQRIVPALRRLQNAVEAVRDGRGDGESMQGLKAEFRAIGEAVDAIIANNKAARDAEIADAAETLRANREAAAESQRIVQALDTASSSVVLADNDHHILYLNRTAQTLFTRSAAELQQDLPGFNPAQLIGASLAVFQGNGTPPALMQSASSSNGEVLRLTIGGRIFRVVVNPVLDYDDTRLGTVLEWTDMTEEVRAEGQIEHLVGQAVAGELAARIDTHALGEGFLQRLGAGINQVLDSIAEMAQTYGGDRRWRIEHAQLVDPADIPRFARLGVIASMQPVHQTSDRLMIEARLGTGRLGGAYAWHSMQVSGVRLAFGSDVPVESPDPYAGMATAVTRMDAKGEPFGGWQPQERVSREDALAGFTTGAAYASFAEGKVGRLSPGLWADFILVDTDPLLATPSELRAAKVFETWVGGKRVWAAKTGD